jgi:hypothetical protein
MVSGPYIHLCKLGSPGFDGGAAAACAALAIAFLIRG